MKLFTLIHICSNEQSIHNNSFVKNFDAQISLYLNCARQLHRSLQLQGIELTVLTNDKACLDRLNTDNYQMPVVQLDFKLAVPSGIKFYSAHFKIEVFEYLSQLTEEYVGLIDADVVVINAIPQVLKNAIKNKLPLFYNITDQISPAYGHDNILKDKALLSKTNPYGIWAGGEFLTGTPGFFKRLYNEVLPLLPSYFSQFGVFNHQGDEMLTSVALENMMINKGELIIDAGPLSIIGRFWSPQTLHVQKHVDGYTDHFLLHLPSDKKFIAKLTGTELTKADFLQQYKTHLYLSRLVEKSFKRLKPYAKKLRGSLSK